MSETEILKQLEPIFSEIFFQPIKVTPNLNARMVSGWDSLAQISLILAIETRFKIRFALGEVESTKNVGDLVRIIQKHIPRA